MPSAMTLRPKLLPMLMTALTIFASLESTYQDGCALKTSLPNGSNPAAPA